MGKRFFSTGLMSDDPWFRRLPPKYKLLWIHILLDCDAVGVWRVDMERAVFQIGCEVDEPGALDQFDGHVSPFHSGQRWMVDDFIEFQYGELRTQCPPHRSYLALLEKHRKKYGLVYPPETVALDYPKGRARVQEKEKEYSEYLSTKLICFQQT